ncbi:MAG: 4-hydroxy-3-methylbut-2-enyl diphosphate reductase [bacterium]
MSANGQNYFRKGLGLKDEVKSELVADYRSALVDLVRANGNRLAVGDLTIHLANEFGFCYGVDRAVEYAYEARRKFPDRTIWLTGEIIHNPHVNRKMLGMDIRFLSGRYADAEGYEAVGSDDVVILPAFGVTTEDMERLKEIGCILVDTTCGSVIVVWKNVERYAREGITSIIHGKFYHEETMATASRATENGGQHLIVRDMDETRIVCDYIRGEGLRREEFLERFKMSVSPGFDPDRHLQRVGLANQTTMLMTESLEIAGTVRQAMVDRWGEEETARRFTNFDTICSATQDRQDAILRLLEKSLDAMVVIGGYNSSNTNNLANISTQEVRTYHIDGAGNIELENRIRFKPAGEKEEVVAAGWLRGDMTVGLTAGASTPNNEIGDAIQRILRTLDLPVPEGLAASA